MILIRTKNKMVLSSLKSIEKIANCPQPESSVRNMYAQIYSIAFVIKTNSFSIITYRCHIPERVSYVWAMYDCRYIVSVFWKIKTIKIHTIYNKTMVNVTSEVNRICEKHGTINKRIRTANRFLLIGRVHSQHLK